MSVTIADKAPWLAAEPLRSLLAVLSRDGHEARIVGGAVRNTLLGEPVTDIDIAATTEPGETMRRVTAAGYRAVPTGEAHGTITVLAGSAAFEVTTLRADIDTDGRHARVSFGRDWEADAHRRDFTINALYADRSGTVIDLVGGLADLASRTVRFIGDPDDRIREDFLRILRFFRFFAWYGQGRPDADGVRACARLKSGLDHLSAERVSAELFKLLAAPDPSRALLWMRQVSALTRILPESEKWGIDAIPGLVDAEQVFGWSPDAGLRLAAIVPPDADRLAAMAKRLRFPSVLRDRLAAWALVGDVPASTSSTELSRRLYRAGANGHGERLRLAAAAAHRNGKTKEAARLAGMAEEVATWKSPLLPVKGADLAALGVSPGPRMGNMLRDLEEIWIDSGFELDRDALLERVAHLRR